MARKSTRQNREQVSRSEELDKRRDERVQRYVSFDNGPIEEDEVAGVEKALRAAAYLLRYSAMGDGIGGAGCLAFAEILTEAALRVSWIAVYPERHFHNATFE